MYQSCPISLRSVDAHIVRIVSFQIAMSTIAFLITQEGFFAYLICFDFILRALRKHMFSPFYMIANQIVAKWSIDPQWCDESPKRFALYLGLVLSLFLVFVFQSGFHLLAITASVVLFTCAMLETLFDFCIGCKLYFVIQFFKTGIKYDRNFK